MPWPQLAIRATVHTPSGDIDTINVHIPNGSGNGWRKVESLEALADALESSDDVARVLAGDFNEPQAIRPDGTVVTFGQRIDSDGSVRLGRRDSRAARPGWFTDKSGHEDDLQRWDAAVRGIFEGSAQHGLRHVHEIGIGSLPPTTHIVRGRPRFFDHLFLSRHFRTTDHHYVDSVRENLRYSDHSALYADVVLNSGTA
jgi:endonuclease/exonuclease/phosphatase family metal-dependent hydrolase